MAEPVFDESQYAEQDRTATGWPRITPPSSTTNSVFVSHTSSDAGACRRWILPAIKRAVLMPVFLDYYSFDNPNFREAYARSIVVNLRCSEHLVVVFSEPALSSPWVQEEVAWWVRRRGTREMTVVAMDSSPRSALHPKLPEAVAIDFSSWKYFAGWRLTRRIRTALFTSDWLIVKRWPRVVNQGMAKGTRSDTPLPLDEDNSKSSYRDIG